jgi:hypothetical protein
MDNLFIRNQIDNHFNQIIENKLNEPYEEIFNIFSSKELIENELFFSTNIKKLENLFSIAALSFTSNRLNGSIYPVIALPSVGIDTISSFLIERLDIYKEKNQNIKYIYINCKNLVGLSPLDPEKSDSIKIPNLIKWRIENEDKSIGVKLFILTNINELLADNSVLFNEVINELSSISSDANFIVFSTPSGYHFIKSSFRDDDFQTRFSRIIYFEGFKIEDIAFFRRVIENRLKTNEKLKKFQLSDEDAKWILETSRGIPFYAFKIVEKMLKNFLLEQNVDSKVSLDLVTKSYYQTLWSDIGNLTLRQIDILAIMLNSKKNQTDIKELGEKLRYIRGEDVGNRTAIIQQTTKLYEKNIIDKERPPRSKNVYYRIKNEIGSAIEYKIYENLMYV